ncbi:MAG: FAD-dependent oxidoreductase [Chloroflexota bacterium]
MTATQTAAWPTFEATLRDRELVADRTMAFRFAKPTDWTFHAGQFIDITLLDPPETDTRGNTRGFSLSSAPDEDVIMITTRLGYSSFKRVLRTMPIGTPVRIEGPFGDLRLHHAQRRAVVLTGGIGITPFRSILLQAAADGGLPYPVLVVYANRRPEDAAFLDELTELARQDPNLTFVPTMSDVATSERAWDGERGRLDASMLQRHLEGAIDAIYYLTGPPGMIDGLRSMLVEAGVDEDDIRTEAFTGY